MKVMKFGGTSVGSPDRMKNVASLITESGDPTFVVLSACQERPTRSLRFQTISTRRTPTEPMR